jgi:hypothetical protein
MTELLVRHRLPEPTVVFDEYWRFACERQRIYLRRLAGEAPPWTDDLILRGHRFTNAYRASDRVSQYLIRQVQYSGDAQTAADMVLRTLLFKFFNRIDTWELITSERGLPHASAFRRAEISDTLDKAFETGARIYSAAYIIPPASTYGATRKHHNHLALLEHMLQDGVVDQLLRCRSLQELYRALLACPSIGEFLAFQFAIDLNYSEVFDFSEMEFVVPGPGAKEGVAKCFSSLGDLDQSDVMRWVAETQEERLQTLGLNFPSLWGRPLQLVDVQNLFCEIGKYARMSHPQFTKARGRMRIKQRYEPTLRTPTAWFPPKWGINERIKEMTALVGSSSNGLGQLTRRSSASPGIRTDSLKRASGAGS